MDLVCALEMNVLEIFRVDRGPFIGDVYFVRLISIVLPIGQIAGF